MKIKGIPNGKHVVVEFSGQSGRVPHYSVGEAAIASVFLIVMELAPLHSSVYLWAEMFFRGVVGADCDRAKEMFWLKLSGENAYRYPIQFFEVSASDRSDWHV